MKIENLDKAVKLKNEREILQSRLYILEKVDFQDGLIIDIAGINGDKFSMGELSYQAVDALEEIIRNQLKRIEDEVEALE